MDTRLQELLNEKFTTDGLFKKFSRDGLFKKFTTDGLFKNSPMEHEGASPSCGTVVGHLRPLAAMARTSPVP